MKVLGSDELSTSIKDTNRSWLVLGLYWMGLIFGTYCGFAEIYVFVLFAVVVVLKFGVIINTTNKMAAYWFPFVAYYLFVTLAGLALGSVTLIKLAEFILKYCFIPMTVYFLLPSTSLQLDKAGHFLRNLILVTVAYGLVESILGHNYIDELIPKKIGVWVSSMNLLGTYQCSSIYLHYSYYGFVLIAEWLLLCKYPLKYIVMHRIAQVLVIEQILVCQSRIAWISFICILMFKMLFGSKTFDFKKGVLPLLVLSACLFCLIFDSTIIYRIFTYIGGRFSNVFKYGFSDGSVGQRLGTLLNWGEYFKKYPNEGLFGTGYSSVNGLYLLNYSMFAGFSTVDCEFTVYLVETGVIGFALAIFAVGKSFQHRAGNTEWVFFTKCTLVLVLSEAATLDLVSNNIIFSLFMILFLMGAKGAYLPRLLSCAEKNENGDGLYLRRQ